MNEVKIGVKSGRRASAFCPVSAEIDIPAERATAMSLVDCRRAAAVPCRVEKAGVGCRLHWVVESIAAGQGLDYVLTDGAPPVGGLGVELSRQEGDRIAVTVGGARLTTYRYSPSDARPSLYPLIGPYDGGVTRSFPFEDVAGDDTDHKHHRSLYWAWGDVNGVDVWGEEEGHGCVRHREFESWGGGPVFGWIKSRNDWEDADGGKLMEDRVTLRFYNMPAGMGLIDFEVALLATEGEVRLGDTKEGGICAVRVATSMKAAAAGRIENSFGGTGEAETWGKRASWCDYSGPVGDHTVGIAIFDGPKNFRYPTYWHVRDYGLMTANPFGLSHFLAPEVADGSFALPAGGELAFRYRLYIHAGGASEGGVRGKYLDWIYPPAVTVEE